MPMVHFRWSLRATLIGATWAASSARSCAAGPAAALAVLARRVLACARGPDLGPLAAWTVGQWCRARAHRSARRWYSRSPSRRHRHTVDARPCCKTGARGLAPARGGSASSAARGRKPCRARDCLLPDPALNRSNLRLYVRTELATRTNAPRSWNHVEQEPGRALDRVRQCGPCEHLRAQTEHLERCRQHDFHVATRAGQAHRQHRHRDQQETAGAWPQ